MSAFHRVRPHAILAAVALTFAQDASAQMANGSAEVGNLSISSAWTRQTPPGARVGGGYLEVTNNGSEPDRLVGGKAEFAARVEIHEMAITDGVMKMAPIADGLEIRAGETVKLKPGGYHIMFMGLKSSPEEGMFVPVTLTFAKAGDVTVTMPVAAIGAPGPKPDPSN